MKKILLILMVFISFGAIANPWNLPPVLYCTMGASEAEFHFYDNGEHWFKVSDSYKCLKDKFVIDKKKLEINADVIRFKQRVCGFSGAPYGVTINRKTGGIFGRDGSGQCSLEKPKTDISF